MGWTIAISCPTPIGILRGEAEAGCMMPRRDQFRTLAPRFFPEIQYSFIKGGLLWDYIKNMGVYRCPVDKTNSTTWAFRDQKMSRYLMNGVAGNTRWNSV